MSPEQVEAAPDERVFRAHIALPRFQEGVDRGRWRIVGDIEWPNVVIAVQAAARNDAPDEYGLRFNVQGYPTAAPTATPWDLGGNCQLAPEKRPKGHRADFLFRSDWNNGIALYAPYDRVALSGHEEAWRQQHPREMWDASKDITFILRNLHHVLNADDYTGI